VFVARNHYRTIWGQYHKHLAAVIKSGL